MRRWALLALSAVPVCRAAVSGGMDCARMDGFCMPVSQRAWWIRTAWSRTGHIGRSRRWMDCLSPRSMIFPGVRIFLLAGICMIRRFARRCSAGDTGWSCLTSRRSSGVSIVRRRNLWRSRTRDTKKYSCASMGRNFTLRCRIV